MLLILLLSCFPGDELPVSVLLIDDRFFGVAEINSHTIQINFFSLFVFRHSHHMTKP